MNRFCMNLGIENGIWGVNETENMNRIADKDGEENGLSVGHDLVHVRMHLTHYRHEEATSVSWVYISELLDSERKKLLSKRASRLANHQVEKRLLYARQN